MNIYTLTGDEVMEANLKIEEYRKLYKSIIPPLQKKVDEDYNNLSWWVRFSNAAGLFEGGNNNLHFKCRLLYPEAGLCRATTCNSLSTLLGIVGLFDTDKYGFKLSVLEALRGKTFLHHKGTESYNVPLLTYFNYKSVLNGGWISREEFV